MKAWIAWWGDMWEGCTLVHAETASKAKLMGMSILMGDEYIEMRVKRIKGLDDIPITYQAAKDAGFQYTDPVGGNFKVDEEGYILQEEFYNDCWCDICRPNKTKKVLK